MFILFCFEAKQSKKRLFSFALKRNKKSESKRSVMKNFEAKQSVNTVYLFRFRQYRKDVENFLLLL
jgi:hypothetical protein